jgi:hypothetical protein
MEDVDIDIGICWGVFLLGAKGRWRNGTRVTGFMRDAKRHIGSGGARCMVGGLIPW